MIWSLIVCTVSEIFLFLSKHCRIITSYEVFKVDLLFFLIITMYPFQDDPEFVRQLYAKKETKDLVLRPDASIFHMHQRFVMLLLNEQTKVDRLLLFHNTGSGKTFLIFGLLETTRMSYTKPAIVLVKNDAIMRDIEQKAEQMIRMTHPKATDDRVARLHMQYLRRYVCFETMNKLRNRVISMRNSRSLNVLIEEYSDRLVIIDEFHNLNAPTVSAMRPEKKTYVEIYSLLSQVRNIRLVAMTASPIVDDIPEIDSVIQLLNPTYKPLVPANKKDLEQIKQDVREHLLRRVSVYHVDTDRYSSGVGVPLSLDLQPERYRTDRPSFGS